MPDAFVTGQVTPVLPPHTAVLFNVKLTVFPLTGMSFENSVALNVAVLPTVPDPCTLISDVAAGDAVGVGVGVGLAPGQGGGVNPVGVKRNAWVSPLLIVPHPTICPPSLIARASTSVVHAASEIWPLRSFISPGSLTPFALSSCHT